MRNDTLQLAKLRLREYEFYLLWNVKAMFDWQSMGMTDELLLSRDVHALAAMVHLMGREAAAASVYYGYVPSEVPDEEALQEYLSARALPWELDECVTAISAALQYGNHRDYDIKNDEQIDIDTLELKKN